MDIRVALTLCSIHKRQKVVNQVTARKGERFRNELQTFLNFISQEEIKVCVGPLFDMLCIVNVVFVKVE